MHQKIRAICKAIEQEHNIRIIFAIENGSRAWRMESADSDYDVRFVFVRPLESYIQLQKPSDVLTYFFDKKGKPCTVNPYLDITGFDIFKFLELLASSNPTTIEWLTTDIVYYGKQPVVLQNLARKDFDQSALFYHYQSLCKANYHKYIASNNDVTYKRYLYTLRGLVNATWVGSKKTVPPISFPEALANLEGQVQKSILKHANNIITIKKQGKEKEKIERISQIDTYVEKFLEQKLPSYKKKIDRAVIDKYLQSMVIGKNI